MRISQLLAVIVALGILVAGYFALQGGVFGSGQSATAWGSFDELNLGSGGGELVGFGDTSKEPAEATDTAAAEETTPGDSGDSSGVTLAPNTESFSADDLGVSFKYPEGINISRFNDGAGETILAQGSVSGIRGSAGFQIFVLPWDEGDDVVTPERIREDLPDIVIDSPQEIALANGKHALIFFSESEGLGRTREVWLIHRAHLYQISTVASLDPWLAGIMSTWRFN